MPEGDSYTYAAGRIAPLLVGHRILGVEGSSPSVRRRSGAVLDQVVESVRTMGKHLLIDLSSGLSIHIHLGMSGRVLTSPPGTQRGRDGRAVRLAIRSEGGTVWVLGAPTVEVERRRVVEASLDHLGPDLLAPDFDMDRFRLLQGRYPPHRSLAEFLLDQRVVAGVGNEYKSEVLYLEGLDPRLEVAEVDGEARERLALRARRLLQANASRAVRSTTGRGDGSLWVYGRTGRPCRRCRSPIEEGWIGDPPRITYWCPLCQR